MVGVQTVLTDDPLLTTRLRRGGGHDPIRVIADSNLRTPLAAAIFNPASSSGVIIATRKDPPAGPRYDLEKRGAKVLTTSGSEQVDLSDLLLRLYRIGITSVLIEGGAQLAWGAFNARVVDRCLFFYAPMIIGGEAAPSGVGGAGIRTLDEAPRLGDVEFRRIGPDMLLNGRVLYPGPNESG